MAYQAVQKGPHLRLHNTPGVVAPQHDKTTWAYAGRGLMTAAKILVGKKFI